MSERSIRARRRSRPITADVVSTSTAPKGATDLADLRRLLLAHPELRDLTGPVITAIAKVGGGPDAVEAFRDVATQPIVSDDDA